MEEVRIGDRQVDRSLDHLDALVGIPQTIAALLGVVEHPRENGGAVGPTVPVVLAYKGAAEDLFSNVGAVGLPALIVEQNPIAGVLRIGNVVNVPGPSDGAADGAGAKFADLDRPIRVALVAFAQHHVRRNRPVVKLSLLVHVNAEQHLPEANHPRLEPGHLSPERRGDHRARGAQEGANIGAGFVVMTDHRRRVIEHG